MTPACNDAKHDEDKPRVHWAWLLEAVRWLGCLRLCSLCLAQTELALTRDQTRTKNNFYLKKVR